MQGAFVSAIQTIQLSTLMFDTLLVWFLKIVSVFVIPLMFYIAAGGCVERYRIREPKMRSAVFKIFIVIGIIVDIVVIVLLVDR